VQSAAPLISVVIPTRSRPDALRRCLQALAAQSHPRERFEVIVVDDGSAQPLDDVAAALRDSLPLTLLRQANAGPGAARNRGAAVARGALLAFTDDDCLPDANWLAALARQHAATPADLLGGRLVNHDPGNPYAEASQCILDGAYRFYAGGPDPGRFFASSNLAVPAAGFAALGGFDSAFRIASEDRDLCARWAASGRALRFVEDAVVRHAPRLDLARFARQHFNYGRGAFRYNRARSRRGAGRAPQGLATHGRFLRTVGAGFAGRPPAERLRLGALLLLWQGLTVAGYLREQWGQRKGLE
jgi:glycosyltransferase involved in cell wall biosynthesis